MIDTFWRDRYGWPLLATGALCALTLGSLAPTPINTGALLLALLVYPPLEETVFRGLIQSLLIRQWSTRWGQLSLANLIASGLFGFAHIANKGLSPLTLGVVLPSLVLGWFYERRQQRLTGPICLHLVFNAGYFLPGILENP